MAELPDTTILFAGATDEAAAELIRERIMREFYGSRRGDEIL